MKTVLLLFFGRRKWAEVFLTEIATINVFCVDFWLIVAISVRKTSAHFRRPVLFGFIRWRWIILKNEHLFSLIFDERDDGREQWHLEANDVDVDHRYRSKRCSSPSSSSMQRKRPEQRIRESFLTLCSNEKRNLSECIFSRFDHKTVSRGFSGSLSLDLGESFHRREILRSIDEERNNFVLVEEQPVDRSFQVRTGGLLRRRNHSFGWTAFVYRRNWMSWWKLSQRNSSLLVSCRLINEIDVLEDDHQSIEVVCQAILHGEKRFPLAENIPSEFVSSFNLFHRQRLIIVSIRTSILQ